MERFAWDLYANGSGEFLDRQCLYTQAVHLLEQAAAAEQQGHKRDRGVHLGNLGIAYYSLEQVDKAIQYLEQALTIQREIGDRIGQGRQLGNLGTAYWILGQIEKAIQYHEQALAIARDIGDKHNQGAQLGNLGLAYRTLGQVDKALSYYQQARMIFQQIGAVHLIAQVDRLIAELKGGS